MSNSIPIVKLNNNYYISCFAIVLRKFRYKEEDFIIDALTDNLGKVRIIVQGKIKNSDQNNNEFYPANFFELTINKSFKTDIFYIKNSFLLKNTAYQLNYEQQLLIMPALDLIKNVEVPLEDSIYFFKLLDNFIEYIKNHKKLVVKNFPNAIVLLWRFIFTVFNLLGISLRELKCSSCNSILTKGFYIFSEKEFSCCMCYNKNQEEENDILYLDQESFFLIRNHRPICTKISQISISKNNRNTINNFICKYYHSFFDRELKIAGLNKF